MVDSGWAEEVGGKVVVEVEVESVLLTRWNILESAFSGGSSGTDGGSCRASKLVSALMAVQRGYKWQLHRE